MKTSASLLGSTGSGPSVTTSTVRASTFSTPTTLPSSPPTDEARPSSDIRYSSVATTASASNGSPLEKAMPSLSVKRQRVGSTASKLSASTGSGVPSSAMRTKGSKTASHTKIEGTERPVNGLPLPGGRSQTPTRSVSAEAGTAANRRLAAVPARAARAIRPRKVLSVFLIVPLPFVISSRRRSCAAGLTMSVASPPACARRRGRA